MSFILDALKKSESDRRQQSSPDIASVPVGRPGSSTPRWLPAVILLLGVNLVAVIVLLLRPTSEPTAAITIAPPAETSAALVGDPEDDPQPAEVTPDPSSPAAGPAPVETPSPASGPAASEPERRSEPEPEPDPVPRPVQKPSANEAVDVPYLTLDELRASGAMNLPDLHIDLHVYSDNPAERFVFINMSQYRENSTLDDGPLLRRITPEGVVLEFRGSTFLLPRD